MRKSFDSVIMDVLKKFGNTISRKQLLGYCSEHKINVPQYLYAHTTGERGVYDLTWLKNKIQDQEKPEIEQPKLTDTEIEHQINSRFGSLDMMTHGVVAGSFKSLIVSGNPGIGKTYTLEAILSEAANRSQILFTSSKGYVKASGIYKMLWDNRHKEAILLMDDCDSIYTDLVALNLLKSALDTTKTRTVCWRSEHKFESEEDGEEIPKNFNYNGSMIFCTNVNLPRAIAQGSKISVHLEALLSRAFYIDLNLATSREMLIRIKSMCPQILNGTKQQDQNSILEYIRKQQDKFRELSLRTLVKCGILWKASGHNQGVFESMAAETMLKR